MAKIWEQEYQRA